MAKARGRFLSKQFDWDIKRVRCGHCARWMHDYKWEEFSDKEVVFCSRACEIEYLNVEEENIVY
jgi:hypothetical protein